MYQRLTLDYVLQELRDQYSGRTAVVFEDESVTYSELYEYSLSLANNLRKLGVRRNTKVAVILPNCMEYIYAYFALFIIGAWIVPINTRYEPDELKRVLANSDADTVIYQDRIGLIDYNKLLLEDLHGILPIRNFIVNGEVPEGALPLPKMFEKDCDLPGMSEENIVIEEIQPDDIAILGYTSGTTGHPKGVMITHKNLILSSYHCGRLLDIQDEDISFSIAPLYAAQGFNAILVYLVSGITMKWISNFNPNDILSHVVKKKISMFHTQPTMWSLLLSMPYYLNVKFKNLNKVVVSGSVCTPTLARRIEESTGCTLLNAYGIIESTGVVTITRLDDPEDVRRNTVGRPIEGIETKIVDQNRHEVKKGEIGELAVRGYLMKGYYKNPEGTDAVIDEDGWLYTGDLACYYKDGENISIVGRCKDMIIRGAFNVYPIDIEECLLNFDKVDDVSVVGKPHEILGECTVAFVIPKPNVTLTKGEVLKFCRGKISNYKVPDEVIFVSQFPVLDSGKIQKNILAQWAVGGVPPENRLLLDGNTVEGMAQD